MPEIDRRTVVKGTVAVPAVAWASALAPALAAEDAHRRAASKPVTLDVNGRATASISICGRRCSTRCASM